jgi:hypothetical protein
MRYFHRAHVAPDAVMTHADAFFGERLTAGPAEPRRRTFAGTMGRLTVSVQAEGGHYTLVTVSTDQPGESEIDKLGKRFLTMVHTADDPTHRPIGAY